MLGQVQSRQFYIEGVALTLVGSFGILGNIAAIFHFGGSKQRRQRFYALMLALAVVDVFVITSFIWFWSVPKFLGTNRKSHYWSIFVYPALHIFATCSIYLTLSVSVERYLSICKPLFHEDHPWSIKRVLIPIMLFTIIYNIPTFFEFKWITYEGGITYTFLYKGNITTLELGMMPTQLRQNPDYIKFYKCWCDIVLRGIIPMLILLILNVLILTNMTRYKDYAVGDEEEGRIRNSQCKMAYINVIIVAVFLVCHSIRQVPSVNELHNMSTIGYMDQNTKWPNKELMDTITEISPVIIVFNSSINFYVYLLKYRILKDEKL